MGRQIHSLEKSVRWYACIFHFWIYGECHIEYTCEPPSWELGAKG